MGAPRRPLRGVQSQCHPHSCAAASACDSQPSYPMRGSTPSNTWALSHLVLPESPSTQYLGSNRSNRSDPTQMSYQVNLLKQKYTSECLCQWIIKSIDSWSWHHQNCAAIIGSTAAISSCRRSKQRLVISVHRSRNRDTTGVAKQSPYFPKPILHIWRFALQQKEVDMSQIKRNHWQVT